MAPETPRIPGYRIKGLLGRGGMGEVYLAEDEVLGRQVAIKTILPEVAGQGERRARFLREARAMATVEHARVVRVYSFGETGGQAYFVMELVEGETLQARLQRTRKLAVEEALRLAREVAEALQAAWARGIVHRDVKPGNIILDAEGHAHVADFGLARPAEASGDAAMTRDGTFVGSPHYVAPEQARAQPADFRTDIYSLGIVLFEMIAGRRPFDGASPMEIVSRQIHEQTPPLRSVAPHAPEPVADLVHTMTAKDPNQRPPSYPTLIASLSGSSPALAAGTLATTSMPDLAVAPPARTRSRRLGALALLLLALFGSAYLLRDRLLPLPRPAGDLVVALLPLYAADDESAKEGRTVARLVESELARIVDEEAGRAVGLASLEEPARSAREARRLGSRARADYVLWGEALAYRGEVEVQAALTRVSESAEAGAGKLGALMFDQQAGSPIEARRRGALRLAEAVARVAAQAALDRGRPESALALMRECRGTAENLALRAAAYDKLGRAEDAAGARQQIEALGK